MTDLILGPAGALPPTPWQRGASVFGQPTSLSGEWLADWRDIGGVLCHRGSGWKIIPPSDLRLDLSRGPLGFGTRALLALALPEEDQPLTAPGWTPTSDRRSKSTLWALTDAEDGEWLAVFVDPAGFMVADYSIPTLVVPGLDDEPDPRRALALALKAAARAA